MMETAGGGAEGATSAGGAGARAGTGTEAGAGTVAVAGTGAGATTAEAAGGGSLDFATGAGASICRRGWFFISFSSVRMRLSISFRLDCQDSR